MLAVLQEEPKRFIDNNETGCLLKTARCQFKEEKIKRTFRQACGFLKFYGSKQKENAATGKALLKQRQ